MSERMDKVTTFYVIERKNGEQIRGQTNRKILHETIVKNATETVQDWQQISTRYVYDRSPRASVLTERHVHNRGER